MCDVSFVVGFGDCSHYCGVVDFLVFVEFVTARVAGGVEVSYVLDVVFDCGDGTGDGVSIGRRSGATYWKGERDESMCGV